MPRVPIHHLIDPNPAPSLPIPPNHHQPPPLGNTIAYNHHNQQQHSSHQSSLSPTFNYDSSRPTYHLPPTRHLSNTTAPPVTFPPPSNFTENGRIYYRYKNVMYPYPVDEAEGGRLDQLHYMIYDTLLDGRLHVANLRHAENNPSFRILDVGFGTSLWAQFVSNAYPKAEVVGIDLKGFIMENSRETFPNLDLRNGVDFNEDDWGLKENSFDFIHLGLLCGSVPDWEGLYRRCLRYLKPGVGQLEHVELDLTPRLLTSPPSAMNGPTSPATTSPPSNDPLQYYWTCLTAASARAGLPIEYRHDTETMLANSGFSNPSDTRFRVPLSDRGMVDAHDRRVGRWFQSAMQHEWGIQSYQGLGMALFTKQLGWEAKDVDDLCARVLDGLRRDQGGLFHTLHVWTARKPSR